MRINSVGRDFRLLAIDTSLDETGQRTAAGYRPTFERADGSAVYALAGTVAGANCLSPAEANATAERMLDDWAYTDGGE